MTPTEIEKRLNMIKYYDLSNQMWQQYETEAAAGKPLSPVATLMAGIAGERIEHNNRLRAEMIKLLDHAASDTDKEVLYRYYVDHQNYFDIAEAAHYSYSYIMSKRADAFHRLAANLQDHPAIAF